MAGRISISPGKKRANKPCLRLMQQGSITDGMLVEIVTVNSTTILRMTAFRNRRFRAGLSAATGTTDSSNNITVKVWKEVANFQLEVESFLIDGDGEDSVELTVHQVRHGEPYTLTVPMTVFNEVRGFRKRVVTARGTVYSGGMDMLNKIQKFVGGKLSARSPNCAIAEISPCQRSIATVPEVYRAGPDRSTMATCERCGAEGDVDEYSSVRRGRRDMGWRMSVSSCVRRATQTDPNRRIVNG